MIYTHDTEDPINNSGLYEYSPLLGFLKDSPFDCKPDRSITNLLYPSNTKSVDGGTLAEKYYIKVLSFKEKVSFNCYDIAYTSSRKNQYNHLI